MMSGLPASLDIDGVAVITGGAGGFGLNVATRLVRAGMAVAILDVSPTAISDAKAALFKEGASSDKVCPLYPLSYLHQTTRPATGSNTLL